MNWNNRQFEKEKRIELLKQQRKEWLQNRYISKLPKRLRNNNF